MLKNFLVVLLLLWSAMACGVEHSIKGLVDLRVVHTNTPEESYLHGGYGKFRYNEGNNLSLGQLGLQYKLDWQNNWSATIVGNGFAEQDNLAFGLTEGYVEYKSLPSKLGWRFKSKMGLYYPKISQENVATAWSTPYTITASSMNNWIGEELRNTGIHFTIEKLGKATKSPHHFAVDIDFFQNNDTAGAMLTWHGWTVGSRQTLLNEKLYLQNIPALNGDLSKQAHQSDPFLELDHRWGINGSVQWRYQNKLKVNLGYYDNRAEKGLVENGQYTWTTAFAHGGFKYKFAPKWELVGQFMQGNTLMTSPTFIHVVDNDFDNVFVMLRTYWQQHHVALRVEHFNVDDFDQTQGDNNNESGESLTLAYRYKLNKQSFILAEYNWLDTKRPSRTYENQAVDLIEQQYQLAYRYYF